MAESPLSQIPTAYPDLAAAADEERFEDVIAGVATAVAADPRAALSDEWIRAWLGWRYRWLVIKEMEKDDQAVDIAKDQKSGLAHYKPVRLRLADRFLAEYDGMELKVDMPPGPEFHVSDTSLMIAPGLLTGLLPDLAFASILPAIEERFGVRVIASDSHPMRGCSENTADLAAAIEQGVGHDAASVYHDAADGIPPEHRVVIFGYSKGGPDTLTLLVERPDLLPRIKAVVGWAPAFLGSPIADQTVPIVETLAEIPLTDQVIKVARAMAELTPDPLVERIQRRGEEYRIHDAIYELTAEMRGQWFEEHRDEIDATDIPIFVVSGDTSTREVPIYQIKSVKTLDDVDTRNDMQVLRMHTQLGLPMNVELASFRAHHWDMSYQPFPEVEVDAGIKAKAAVEVAELHTDHPFPRFAAMSALLMTLHEIGIFT